MPKIQVDARQLREEAAALTAHAAALREELQSLYARAAGTEHYWQGEAAETHRAAFADTCPDAERLCADLFAHAAHLQSIADGYTQTEKGIRQTVRALPQDAID